MEEAEKLFEQVKDGLIDNPFDEDESDEEVSSLLLNFLDASKLSLQADESGEAEPGSDADAGSQGSAEVDEAPKRRPSAKALAKRPMLIDDDEEGDFSA